MNYLKNYIHIHINPDVEDSMIIIDDAEELLTLTLWNNYKLRISFKGFILCQIHFSFFSLFLMNQEMRKIQLLLLHLSETVS